MRKLSLVLCFILLFSVSAQASSYEELESSLIDFGDKPWEIALEKKEEQQKAKIKKECAESQKAYEKKVEEIKKKKAEEKRKKEQEERERKAREEAERIEAEKWEKLEEKDYAVDQSSSAKEKAEAVVEYAKDHVGAKYTWGGESWKTGVDCSGFVKLCYKKFGVDLPHYSGDMRHVGKPVKSLKEAEAGDIICYDGHVGLYIGNGQMIHASRPGVGVVITKYINYKKILTIRRIYE